MCPVTLAALGIGTVAATGAAGAATAGAGAAAAGAGAAAAGAGAAGISTLQVIGLGLTLASTAIGVVGSLSASKATSAGLKAAADEKRRAAGIARENGEEESDRRRRAGASTVSEQKARAAAAGVDPTTGSALDLLDDSEYLVEDDALTIRKNSEERARGNIVEASFNDTSAQNARRSGIFNAAGTVLTGASKVAAKWNAFRTPSVAAGAY